MKPPYPLLAAGLLLLTSCFYPELEPTSYYPLLLTRESLERSVNLLPAEVIGSADKLLYKGSYLFILERTKGIHIIDNVNKQNPANRGFIAVPGCMDIAVKDNTLYTDNAVDMVAIDISNIGNSTVTVSKRIKDNFPELRPPDESGIPEEFMIGKRPANTVIVAWEK